MGGNILYNETEAGGAGGFPLLLQYIGEQGQTYSKWPDYLKNKRNSLITVTH